MSGKVAIVTGGTSGIGRLLAFRLVSKGVYVVLPCRDVTAGSSLVRHLQEMAPEGWEAPVAECHYCDHSNLQSVAAFAKAWAASGKHLHLFVQNAGMCPKVAQTAPVVTVDGYEEAFQCNHLAHFLMTRILQPRLIASSPARVVVVSSGLHVARRTDKQPPSLVVESLDALKADWRQRPNGMLLYKNSKLANTAFAFELHHRLAKHKVTVNAVSPGFIPATGLSRKQGLVGRVVMRFVMPWVPASFIATLADGADALEHACFDPELESAGGLYLAKHVPAPSHPDASNPEVREALWELSEAMVAPYL